jgi:hypothetical protein
MACDRCGGCAVRIAVVTAEGLLTAHSCVNCGRVFGDAVIDHHHGLDPPPEPYPPVTYSIWDPQRRRLTSIATPTQEA